MNPPTPQDLREAQEARDRAEAQAAFERARSAAAVAGRRTFHEAVDHLQPDPYDPPWCTSKLDFLGTDAIIDPVVRAITPRYIHGAIYHVKVPIGAFKTQVRMMSAMLRGNCCKFQACFLRETRSHRFVVIFIPPSSDFQHRYIRHPLHAAELFGTFGKYLKTGTEIPRARALALIADNIVLHTTHRVPGHVVHFTEDGTKGEHQRIPGTKIGELGAVATNNNKHVASWRVAYDYGFAEWPYNFKKVMADAEWWPGQECPHISGQACPHHGSLVPDHHRSGGGEERKFCWT